MQPTLFERQTFTVFGMETLFREGEDGNAGSLHANSCRGVAPFSSYRSSSEQKRSGRRTVPASCAPTSAAMNGDTAVHQHRRAGHE